MSLEYETSIVLQVTPRHAWSPKIVVTIKRDWIEFSAPELKESGVYFAQAMATSLAGALKRAKRIHRQVFGRACR